MSAVIDRLASWRALPLAAALVTLAIGLVFIFVWAPHPWGWFGIDQYHQLAVELANGGSFQTFDVPWGYAYYLAPFYWLFGPTPLPALIVQALVNAAIPPLVYFYAVRAFDRRVAAVATVLVAVLSFNTVYVSTESTDSLSTAMFMAMLLAYVHGRRVNRDRWFVVAGILAGVAAQFRPNLVLLPFVLAALNWLLGPRTWVRVRQGAALALTAIVLLVPWVVAQLRVEPPVPADQHAWRHPALVRHAANRPVYRKPRAQSAERVRHLAVRLHQPEACADRVRRVDELRAGRAGSRQPASTASNRGRSARSSMAPWRRASLRR